MTKHLDISVLGPVRIQLDDRPLTGLPSRAAEALLIYLACHRAPIARETLANLLWADRSQERALTNLRTILTALRRKVGDHLLVTRQTLAFNHAADYWLDAAEFEETLTRLLPQIEDGPLPSADLVEPLRAALNLYRSDFLEGFHLRHGREFEAWALLRQEQFRRLAHLGLRRLVAHYLARGDYQTGLIYAGRLLALDPYGEEIRRQMMWLLARSNQFNAALRQYHDLRRVLAEELGVEPAPETTNLYRRLKLAPSLRLESLPGYATPFVGREAELEQLRRYLANPHCRLVSLVGPGGVGKTRLAVQVVAQHRSAFLHGFCFVSLASLTSAHHLSVVIANALQLSPDPTADPTAQLLDALKEREILLLLDNFEQLLSASPAAGPQSGAASIPAGLRLLIDILDAAPEVKLLITSRERLNLEEEWVFAVAGLPAPPNSDVDNAASYSAVQLFLQSARRVKSDFVATRQRLAEIVRICHLVDGLPLGLKLAAAWTPQLPCREIADRIERSMAVLRSSAHNTPTRHRSIQAVFDHSWRLLPPDEQQLLRRLSVFVGGFDLTAAGPVAGATEAALTTLVNKSWLNLDSNGRYELHALLQRYLAGMLGATATLSEEALAVKTRHAEYFMTFLRDRRSPLEGPGQTAALADIMTDIDNVQTAWQWAIEQNRLDLLLSAADSAWRFYEIKGWFLEGLEAFAKASAWRGVDQAPPALAPFFIRRGWFCLRLGRFEQGEQYLQQGLALARTSQDQSETARALHYLGLGADSAGRYHQARTWMTESLEIYRRIEAGHFELGSAVASLGFVLWRMGQFEQGEAHIEEGIFHYERCGDPRAIALMYSYLGGFAIQKGEYDRAETLLDKGLAYQTQIKDRVMIRMSLAWRGEVYEQSGNFVEAEQQYAESLAISRGNGDRVGAATALVHLSRISLVQDKPQQAGQYLKKALTQAADIRIMPVIMEGLLSAARLLAQRGNHAQTSAILATIDTHPASQPHTKTKARQLLANLLPPGSESQPAQPLETIVANLMALEL